MDHDVVFRSRANGVLAVANPEILALLVATHRDEPADHRWLALFRQQDGLASPGRTGSAGSRAAQRWRAFGFQPGLGRTAGPRPRGRLESRALAVRADLPRIFHLVPIGAELCHMNLLFPIIALRAEICDHSGALLPEIDAIAVLKPDLAHLRRGS